MPSELLIVCGILVALTVASCIRLLFLHWELKALERELGPCWVPCPDCDDFWCERHELHVCDCDCPPIEDWVEDGWWPYK